MHHEGRCIQPLLILLNIYKCTGLQLEPVATLLGSLTRLNLRFSHHKDVHYYPEDKEPASKVIKGNILIAQHPNIFTCSETLPFLIPTPRSIPNHVGFTKSFPSIISAS